MVPSTTGSATVPRRVASITATKLKSWDSKLTSGDVETARFSRIPEAKGLDTPEAGGVGEPILPSQESRLKFSVANIWVTVRSPESKPPLPAPERWRWPERSDVKSVGKPRR